MELSGGQLVNMHLLDSMKPSNVGNEFNPKTYWIPYDQFGSSVKWSVFNNKLQQPTLRAYRMGYKKYILGIPLETYRNHISWGGRSYPLVTIDQDTFAIPYIDTDNGINGNGILFEPEKTDIVWWFRNRTPFTNHISYTMFLYNEPTGLYIYLETMYLDKNDDGSFYRGFTNGPISFAVTANEYNSGKLPYVLRSNSRGKMDSILCREKSNDAPYRETPFYDIVKTLHIPYSLFNEEVKGHKGTSPANWTMQVSHDPSGAYHSFRSYGKELDPNDTSIVKPYE